MGFEGLKVMQQIADLSGKIYEDQGDEADGADNEDNQGRGINLKELTGLEKINSNLGAGKLAGLEVGAYSGIEQSINDWELDSAMLTELWTAGAANNPFSQPIEIPSNAPVINNLEGQQADLQSVLNDFKKVDSNQDGVLDAKEIATYLDDWQTQTQAAPAAILGGSAGMNQNSSQKVPGSRTQHIIDTFGGQYAVSQTVSSGYAAPGSFPFGVQGFNNTPAGNTTSQTVQVTGVSQANLQNGLSQLGSSLEAEKGKPQHPAAQYDLDGDGKISKAEFDLAINRLARKIEIAAQAMALISEAKDAQDKIFDGLIEGA